MKLLAVDSEWQIKEHWPRESLRMRNRKKREGGQNVRRTNVSNIDA